MCNYNCCGLPMDQQTLIWILGVMSTSIAFLYFDRMRESKRITVMETKMDALIKGVDTLTTRVDLFLKTEIDTLKKLADK